MYSVKNLVVLENIKHKSDEVIQTLLNCPKNNESKAYVYLSGKGVYRWSNNYQTYISTKTYEPLYEKKKLALFGI